MVNNSRRKFLYAGAGVAAAAGIGYLTKDYWLHSPESTISPSPTATPIITETPQPTVTETTTMSTTESTTPSKPVDLELQLFHDFHGDGVKQDDEPAISDALFDVIDEKGDKILQGITGNSGGIYSLEDLIEGQKYRLEFADEEKKYRHISISNSEFHAIDQFQLIPNSDQTKIQLGLMNGYLTLPFKKGTHCPIGDYYDRGRRKGWRGKRSYGGHTGTDFYIPKGTNIVASAPGNIVEVTYHSLTGNYVTVYHGNGKSTSYLHLNQSLVHNGQKIIRGELIGLSGDTGSPGIFHLHFQLQTSVTMMKQYALDPFDVYISAWTKDNDPQYPIPD